jgi:hypothetical protein
VSEKKPRVEAIDAKRKCCPVCGKASYSLTGTHPQCLMSKAAAVLHAAQKAAGSLTQAKVARPTWSKH